MSKEPRTVELGRAEVTQPDVGSLPGSRRIIWIVSRNNLHLTKQAVKSARAQSPECTVAVLDNASTDGTSAWLNTQPIVFLARPRRISLAECWNCALQVSWYFEYEHAMLCNNDIELRPDAYKLLLAQGGEFVSCVSVDSAERMGRDFCLGDENPVHHPRLASPRPHPDFSCFLIRKSVTDKVGWFNQDYFPAYAEDAEYHVRMHRAEVQAVCVDVPFLHHAAQTVKQADPAERALIERGAAKNRERFRETYGCLPGTPEYEKLFT